MAISLEQFIDRLTESGLMSAAELGKFQDGLPADQRPGDVQALVALLYRAGKLTKYQAKAVYEGKGKSLVFDEYVVLDQIGQGGMGVVLKAQHRRMKRLVAIKMLPDATMKSPAAIERFYREVEAAAKLAHPNIVQAYDAREHEGRHCLVMEFIDGRDLAATVRQRGPLPLAEAVDLCIQAAKGLHYAHKHGIVHRDIKPGNLLLDKDGTLKILDMGLALIVDAEQGALGDGDRLTASGQIMGTYDYMAPEQALDTRAADARSDIYSLGCTLCRLLTGRPPYPRDTTTKTLFAHRDEPVPSLAAARPDVSEELDLVFRTMIAKQPAERFANMGEVIAALERALKGPGDDDPSANTRALKASLAFLDTETQVKVATDVDAPEVAETVDYRPDEDTSSSAIPALLPGAAPAVVPPPALVVPPLGGNSVKIPPGHHVPMVGGTTSAQPASRAPGASGLRLGGSQIGKRGGSGIHGHSGIHGSGIRKRKPKGPSRSVALAIAAATLGALALAGAWAFYAFKPGDATLAIECKKELPEDVQVSVSQAGKEVKLADAQSGWTLKLRPGSYDLALRGGDDQFQLDRSSIALKSGGREELQIVPIELPPAEQAQREQQRWARQLARPAEYTNSIGMKFVLIPPGTFDMGSGVAALGHMAGDADKWSSTKLENEQAHTVKIAHPFYLGVCTATQEQYQHLMGANPSHFSAGGDGRAAVAGQDTHCFPVENVSQDDAIEFCKKLSARQEEVAAGMHYRLPTEAEWEYACRADSESIWHFGDYAKPLGEYAWFGENSEGRTHPVGQLKPNAWGLFDLYGNVRQWCADRYADSWYGVSPREDPLCAAFSEEAVARGGGYDDPLGYCRSAARHRDYAGAEKPHVGFRVLLEIEHQDEPAPPPPKREFVNVTIPGNERWTEWKDLFDGKTLDGWQVSQGTGFENGRVTVADGCINLQVDQEKDGLAAIVAQAPIPKVNYELRIEAKRLLGADCASIVFPIGEAHCALLVPSDRGGVRLRRISDNDTPNDETPGGQIDFKNDAWHNICLRVLTARITALIDDQKLIDLPTSGHSFSTDKNLQFLFPFGIYSYSGDKSGCNSQIRKIQIRELKSAGEVIADGGAPALPMKRPAPVHVEIKPEPLPAFKAGQPLSKLALVTNPAPLPGVLSWTVETVRHRGIVEGMAFSPDGARLALGGEDGTIRIVNPADGKLIRALVGQQEAIRTLSWSPDGRYIVSASNRGPAVVWDVESARMLRHDLFDADVAWAEWSPDGRRIAGLACTKHDVVIVDLVDGTRTAIPCQESDSDTPSRGVLAWSPDGSELAYYRTEQEKPWPHSIHIWDAQGRRELRALEVNSKSVWGCAISWSPDASILAFRSDNGAITFLNPRSGEIVRQTSGDCANAFAWSPDARSIFLGREGQFERRGIPTWSRRWITVADRQFDSACCLSPDGRLIVVSSAWYGGCREILSETGGNVAADLNGYNTFLSWQHLSMSHDGNCLAICRDDGAMRLWNPASGYSESALSDYPIRQLGLSGDGRVYASNYWGSDKIGIVSTAPVAPLASIPVGGDAHFSLSYTGKSLLSWDYNLPGYDIWDIASKSIVCKIALENGTFASLNPDATMLAIANEKGAKIFDVKSGSLVKSLVNASVQPNFLAWSPNNKLLAGGTLSGGIDIWDVASGKHIADRESLAKAACFQAGRNVEALDWLDDKTLVLGNNSGACVWSMPTRSIVREIPGGNYYWGMTRCFFGAGGRKVAFTGASAVHLRSLDDGRLFYTIVLLSDDPQKCAVLGPEGHWRGPPEAAEQFVYVVQTERGQETLSPADFAAKYGWKNDPAKAVGK